MRLDRIAALLEPLAGLPVTVYEHKVVEVLTSIGVPAVAVIAALLGRARAADPLPVTEGRDTP